MAPKHVLMPHRPHSFIVNVQPSFPSIALSVRVEHVDSIVSAVCRLAVVIKHSVQLVVRRLHGFSSNRYHDFWNNIERKEFLALPGMGEAKQNIVPSGISSSGAN
jgi:hypothetical protein